MHLKYIHINKDKVKVIFICRCCYKIKNVIITNDQLNMIKENKKKIQDILPDHKPEERELFITSICGECYDDLFSKEDGDYGS